MSGVSQYVTHNINHRDIFHDQINLYLLIFVDGYYSITMLEFIKECLYALIYYYILLRECIQISIITIIIVEVQRKIPGNYKSYNVSGKKGILEGTKVSSTREVARKYCMNEATIRRWRTQVLHLQRHKSGRRYGGVHPLSYPIALEQDIHVVTWVLQRQDKNLAVSRNAIQLVACTVIYSYHSEF